MIRASKNNPTSESASFSFIRIPVSNKCHEGVIVDSEYLWVRSIMAFARRRLLTCLLVALGFTQLTETAKAQGLYQNAQQFTNVVVQTFSTAPLLYSITYQTRFVLVDKDCNTLPGSASQWISSSDITDEQNKNSFLLFKDKLVVSAASLSDLAGITASYEPYGFSFGDIWEYHQTGGSGYYQEVLPAGGDTLTVKSVTPNTGVLITVTPNDASGNGNGTTTFTRTYNNNPSVTLRAPVTAGGNSFSKWQLDGADWSTALTTSVFMNQPHTITAVYNVASKSIGPGLGIGCQLPGYSMPHLIYQYRNVQIITNEIYDPPVVGEQYYTIIYDTRSALISPNFNVANDLIPEWQTNLVIDASVEPELTILYKWLNEKTVISFGDNSQGMSDMADYEANCFLWGDYEQANLSGVVYHYYEVVPNTECLEPERLADFQPNGMTSVGSWRSQALERITNATPSEMFPALEVSFHWDQDAQHAGPNVDLLCASYEVNSFVDGSRSSCPSNAWTVPTWIIIKGADLRTPNATVDCNITPAMLGLSSEFYVTNNIVPTLTPLKLVSIERFPDHHHPFTRFTYETDLALGFKMVAPAVFPGEPRFYTFGAGHKCRLIYEYAFDPILANDGEWFLNTITGGATNEQLCLNPLERAYGSLLNFNKCLSRFKVVDAQGFVNWGLLDSSNAVPQEATEALERLNKIFAQFPLECAAKGFAAGSEDNPDSPRFLEGESAGMVSTCSQGSLFEPTEPDILFQGDFDSSGRHLNYVTFGCDSVSAKDQRRKDQEDILTGLQTRDFIYGQRDLRVRLYGMRPRFPVIRGQTTQVAIHSGDRATLFGHVDAIYQPSFQWYRGPSGNLTGLISPIDAATGYAAGKDHTGTNSMLITAPLTGSTNFWFQVSNIYGSTNSQTIQVVVSSAPDAGKPVVDGATINLEIEKGKTLQLSPPITGSYPLSFQWLLNGVVVNDATNPILQITNISTLLAGTYAVVASNAYGTITGQVAVVSVTEAVSAPVITSFSTNQTVAPGTDVTLSVDASGNPLFYVWKKDGQVLTGATNSSLDLVNVSAQEAGAYQVIVYNDLGSAASPAAQIVVQTPPSIEIQPMSLTNALGTTATFSVGASGTSPLVYQWRKNGLNLSNGANISGAGLASLTLTGVQSADAGNYDVVVTNNYGAVTSAVVVLTVLTNLEVSGWSALGSGTDDSVWSLAVSDTNLYAGAWFTMAGGVSVNSIAKWNGSSWSALGAGIEGGVIALAVSGTNLYAGGSFETAGDAVVNSIAKWNGSSWSALGSGTDGNVSALAESGTNLYAGGDFTMAGGVSANCIAKWNGSSWSALGSGMNGQVWALAVMGTNLYAAGLFTTAGGVSVNHVARWNGSSWSALGSGMNDDVYALAVVGTNLYAGGYFTTAGGVSANYVAKWNGSSWNALGSGMNDWVKALAESGTNLYAGGDFTIAGGVSANYVARWNGSSWSPLGSGLDESVYVLEASGNDLYAGGVFSMAGGVPANNIAKWGLMSAAPPAITSQPQSRTNAVGTVATFTVGATGTAPLALQWRKNGVALSNTGNISGATSTTLTVANVQSTDAGNFDVVATNSYGAVTSAVAVLTVLTNLGGSSWSALGPGIGGDLDATVLALAVSGSDLYVGGSFTNAGGVMANNIAKWNGSSWNALGSGMNDAVTALAVSGSDVYVGGGFTTAGGATASYIAKWNGSSWSAVGSGMNDVVKALAVSGSNVYAGGAFTMAGGVTANHIAKWNGSNWTALGSGMNSPEFDVDALAASGSDLYAGGYFTNAGGVMAKNIAKWNGSSWSALGSGIVSNLGLANPFVTALAVSGSDLYAGGSFTSAGGVMANNIAKWNGSSWSALGSGMNNNVYALAVSGTNLYAAGIFTTADGVTASYIAKWNGSSWSALGSGMNDWVLAMAASGSDVYVGGDFTIAGGVMANHIAKWFQSSAILPTITAQPQSLTNVAGTTASFSVTALGTAPLSYQWRSNSVPLAGATASSYSIPNVQATHAANYDVIVTNYYGAVTSAVATLTITTVDSLSITTQPASRTNYAGTLVEFAVSATGTGALTYQWRKNGLNLSNGGNISGVTTEVLLLTSVQGSNAGAFDVVVSDNYGAVTSSVATLTVTLPPPPRITSVARTNGTFNLEVAGAANSTWSVLRSSSLLGPWTAIGHIVLSVNGIEPFVDTNPPPLMAFYRLSDTAPQPPFITQQPTSQSTSVGAIATFAVAANGALPLYYQWEKSGVSIVGANEPSLSITNVQLIDAGNYTVVLANMFGSVTSTVATLSVNITNTLEQGLLVWLPFDGDTLDASGNMRDGTNQGVTFTNNRFGESNSAAAFAPGVSVVVTNLDPDLQTNGLSFGAWVRFDQWGQVLIWVDNGSWGSTYLWAQDSNFEFRVGTGNPATDHWPVPSSVVLGDWNHIFITHSPSNDTLYVNGQLLGTWPSYPAANNVDYLTLGTGFTGAMDNLMVYGRELSSNEVFQLYVGGVTGSEIRPPEIVQQPQGRTNNLGSTATFVAGVRGNVPLHYLWRHDGAPLTNDARISGTQTPNLTINDLAASDAGDYDIMVTNVSGSITSLVASLTIRTNELLNRLLLWLPFNGDAKDASGYGRDGTVLGAMLTSNRLAQADAAYLFNGSSEIQVSNLDLDVLTNGFSFGAWIRPDADGGVLSWDPDGDWGSTFLISGTPLHFRIGTGSPATDYLNAAPALQLGEWSHVLITHLATRDRLYVNGELAGEWPSSATLGNKPILRLGAGYAGSLVGALDEVVVYGRELSGTEVLQLYQTGLVDVPWIRIEVPKVNPNHVDLSFTGSANSSWKVERALSAGNSWTNLGNFLIGPEGIGQFQDTNPPPAASLYRAVSP